MGDCRQLTIARLGAQGDGIAMDGDTPRYIAYALPGEIVEVDVEWTSATLQSIVAPSPDRVAPICPHFTDCGGCAVQHLAEAAYCDWKHGLVVQALASRGITFPVAPVHLAKGFRRRATFSLARARDGVVLGFNRAQSHDIVDLAVCPVVAPAIVRALPDLRGLAEPLLPRRDPARMTVTETSTGLDIRLDGIAKTLDADLRAELAATANVRRYARISVNGEPVFEAVPPSIEMSGVSVVVPPGAFIQAMQDAETRISDEIVAAIGKAKNVADLFCGVGAFSFALARRAKVTAIDSGADAISALQSAARHGKHLKPITAVRRDLFREPLARLELNAFDAVVFDPPRAGAEGQARMLAKSKVATVVAVSCNPATLARDLRMLIDGGYRLEKILPVDQFRYTAHIEVVAILRR